jgi:hypothetical protein
LALSPPHASAHVTVPCRITQLDTRSTGHTTKIKHVKSHPELGLVLTMGQEQTRDRGELVAWAVQPVRVMDTTFAPLTAVTRMKHPGKWDPSLSM